MHFKSLSLFGFKSFADKTYLELPKGITCIVGPNGSGKSNILDALRWVFGEQRASELRGEEMGEIIFGGTDARRGANYAEVLLTLDDVEASLLDRWGSASELTVARKIYRTGEREYFINGRKARLKDVRDVFFDAGVSSKSISIIEQEKITRIVNATPMELRNYLEETAGLIRYKERRKDAEIRLKQTGENLTRIGDILSVLSEDIIRLEGQVSLLEDYKCLKAERELLEKTGICIRYRQLYRERKSHTAQLDALQESVLTLARQHTDSVNSEIAMNEKLALLRNDINSARRKVEANRNELSRRESAVRSREQERENAGNIRAIAEDDLKTFSENLALKVKNLREAEDAQLLDTSAVKETEEKLSTVKGDLAVIKDALASINALKKEENRKYIRLAEFVSECKNRLSLKRAERLSFDDYIRKYDREIEGFNNESADNAEALLRSQKKEGAVSGEFEKLRSDLNSARGERETARERLRDAESYRAKLNSDIKIIGERIAFLKKEASQKSGGEFIELFKAVRYVSICTDEELKGLYSDLLIIDDELLGKALQYAKTAEDSFQFTPKSALGDLELGRAEKIAEGLYKINNIYKRVGAESLAVLKLTKRIEEEEGSFLKLKAKKEGADSREQSERETLCQAGNKAARAAEELKKAEQLLSSVKNGILHLEEQRKEILRKIKTVKKEKELLLKSAEEAVPEIERLENELSSAERELSAHSIELEKLDGSLESENIKIDALRAKELEYEKAYAAAATAMKARVQEIAAMKRDMAETENNIKKVKNRLSETAVIFSTDWDEGLKELRAATEGATAALLKDQDELNKLIAEEPEIEASLTELRREMDKISRELAEADKKGEYHKLKGEAAEEGISDLSALLFSEFGEALGEVSGRYITDKDITEVNAEADRISKEMDGLGELNMAAKTEYDEKLSQYKRQTEQLEDVKNAIASLNALISEIDSESSALFEETFYSVRKNLKEVFAKFFGAGETDIKLTEPNNLLQSGVELTFNPPGKKIANKNLLSGGEKAVAALVLLFALFLRKPTPFCFLDEVDAPLDDENGKKFIAMIKEAAENTQFMIITHKHLTMSYADTLYGVTMQEGGVSMLLSVELKG
ncbi:MAG: AAA family ATPase [Deferribacteraceae bacterium]|jgi:chromosome segregation protein|nr:AAA family ATPase [Deferribacteraceae bacterium]